MMNDEQFEQARRMFWKWFSVEIDALDMQEVRELLVLLPIWMTALHYHYQTGKIYGDGLED